MQLVEQFIGLERGLEDDWGEITLELTLADETRFQRALALLAPATPATFGQKIRFSVSRGGGISPEAARRLLRRLDHERIWGSLDVVHRRSTPIETPAGKEPLQDQWERQLALLPEDWSDLYGQVTLDSTDYLEPGALRLAPLNPSRYGSGATLRFRVAHNFGYGASAEMASRCFARCDEQVITGTVEILHVLSDTQPVATQGPVWFVSGRNV